MGAEKPYKENKYINYLNQKKGKQVTIKTLDGTEYEGILKHISRYELILITEITEEPLIIFKGSIISVF